MAKTKKNGSLKSGLPRATDTKQVPPRLSNPHLPTLWVDQVSINGRVEPAVALLRFYTLLPQEGIVETCRIQTPISHLRAIAESIREALQKIDERNAVGEPADSASSQGGEVIEPKKHRKRTDGEFADALKQRKVRGHKMA